LNTIVLFLELLINSVDVMKSKISLKTIRPISRILFIFLIIFLYLDNFILAQDMAIYHRYKDDNLEIPDLPANMTLEEFQILSRNLRMADMAYSAIVPGYAHFKAKEPELGYRILGIRIAGYSGLTWSYLKLRDDDSVSDVFETIGKSGTYSTVFQASLAITLASYVYDWIHGRAILNKKKELIRYRYSIKQKIEKNLSRMNSNNFHTLLTFNYNF